MRSDIQVLRGVAVLAVVLCHAFPQWFPYGYRGVDLFFVISGFLITKVIVKEDFSFSGFYIRRVRRLLPAALTTLGASTIIAAAVLSPSDWAAFRVVLVASLTFTANMVRPEAFVHPLAHIWSLSLEEQFYFIYPLLLWLIPARQRLAWLSAFAALSFAGWLFVGGDARFYLLPFRAWQLLAGGLLYLGGFTKPLPLHLKPLELIGDWSYSLFLIHWPLMAFAAVFVGWPLPPMIAVALCFVSVALGALQYEYVEQRFRLTNKAIGLAAIERPATRLANANTVDRIGVGGKNGRKDPSSWRDELLNSADIRRAD